MHSVAILAQTFFCLKTFKTLCSPWRSGAMSQSLNRSSSRGPGGGKGSSHRREASRNGLRDHSSRPSNRPCSQQPVPPPAPATPAAPGLAEPPPAPTRSAALEGFPESITRTALERLQAIDDPEFGNLRHASLETLRTWTRSRSSTGEVPWTPLVAMITT